MAAHARFYCSVWADGDFRALSPGAQRMYLFLASQHDLSMCGLLIVRERFWATSAKGLTPEEVHRDVCELRRTRFVVVDDDTEELLVRSKVRWDQVLAGPKLLKPLARAASRIVSAAIGQVLASELDRCLGEGLVNPAITDPVRLLAESLTKQEFSQVDTLSDTLLTRENKKAVKKPPSSPSPDDLTSQLEFPQVDTLSNGVPDRDTDRVRGKGDVVTDPVTGRARARARAGRKPKPGSDSDPAFTEFWAAYPRKTAKGAARDAWAKALKAGADPQTMITAAARFSDSPHRKPDFTPHPATWLNQERWEDDPGYGGGQARNGQLQHFQNPDPASYQKGFRDAKRR